MQNSILFSIVKYFSGSILFSIFKILSKSILTDAKYFFQNTFLNCCYLLMTVFSTQLALDNMCIMSYFFILYRLLFLTKLVFIEVPGCNSNNNIFANAMAWLTHKITRTMRAGCRCENVVFFFVTLRDRSTVRSRGA